MKLIFKVNKPFDTVFDHLTDMKKYVSVHPVISRMDSISDGSYRVHETLKFGFIPFSFTYPTTVSHSYEGKSVIFKARVMRLTAIEISISLYTHNNITTIEETITFSSPLPVISIIEGIFRRQHHILFQNINSLK